MVDFLFKSSRIFTDFISRVIKREKKETLGATSRDEEKGRKKKIVMRRKGCVLVALVVERLAAGLNVN